MAAIERIASELSRALWGAPMLILLMGTHILLTVRTRFVQRHLGRAIKLSVTKDSASPNSAVGGNSNHVAIDDASGAVDGDISQFGALTTALAATIGTGNIVGVATAVALGGPGAVLWCWLAGVLGIATKYGEGLLAVKYRVKTSDGTMLGGPMYALERGVRSRGLALAFAALAALASFGIGSSAQAGSLVGILETQFGAPPFLTSVIAAALTAVVILGGIKSISKVCTLLVPFMAVFYTVGCVSILIMNAPFLGKTLSLIFKGAFTARAASGGFVGSTVMTAARFGIARGLFSNESGLGSAPIAAAAAQTRNPVRQALVSMTGTFWDTVVLCALTGLTLVSAIARRPAELGGLSGGELTSAAFDQIPVAGPVFLAVGLALFAFSTILGWSYYGERCVEYLFGKKAVPPYKAVYVASAFFGGVMPLGAVWDIADVLNALMAIPNLISLLLLSGVIVSETKKYLWSGGDARENN